MKKPPTDLDDGTIRRIDWPELVPAVLLPRAFRVAVSFRVLWLATCGVLFTLILGAICGGALKKSSDKYLTDSPYKLAGLAKLNVTQSNREPTNGVPANCEQEKAGLDQEEFVGNELKNGYFKTESVKIPTLAEVRGSVLYPWAMLTDTLCSFVPLEKSFSANQRSFIWIAGNIVIWTLIGSLITRTAALRFTIDRRERMSKIDQFVKWRWKAYFCSVFLPICGLLFCGGMVYLAGLFMRIPVLNYLVALLFPFALFFGFCFGIIAIGLLFGWPLLFAAISVDGSDGFDAVSRTYSYLYQRPLHYLVYVIFAVVIGAFGWVFISGLVDIVLALVINACDITNYHLYDVSAMLVHSCERSEAHLTGPQNIVFFWCECFQLLKVGYLFG
ncbi:MAG: hypothetical protein ACRC2T_02095, partial [Thermoguttaceae bacterium]